MSLFKPHVSGDTTTTTATIRKPALAKRFYKANSQELKNEIQQYLTAGKPLSEHPKMIICPHAGYIYSGTVAGKGYATIDKSCNKVIILGPSHHKAFLGISIPSFKAFETPLGIIPLCIPDIEQLRKSKMVQCFDSADIVEHSIEVQLPFLQCMLDSFSLIPILCGEIPNPKEIAALLQPLITDKTLIIISSDLSHYNSNERAKKIDNQTIKCIINTDIKSSLDACGQDAIHVGMELSAWLQVHPFLLDARNSHETAPLYSDQTQVVGYAAIAYLSSEAQELTKDAALKDDELQLVPLTPYSEREQSIMLQLARQSLESSVKGAALPQFQNPSQLQQQKRGCFVTLQIDKKLRGCMGYLEGIKPLYQAIIDNAKNAALHDIRFRPVSNDELLDVTIEISILTPPVPIYYSNVQNLLDNIKPHVDGIILIKGDKQATYLPQVWEQLPDKIQFLEQLALKAGLRLDGWKNAEFKKYQVFKFEEK